MMESFGIATSAMLAELQISVWTGRKLDRKVSEEVDAVKGTKVRGGNYHKHLLAGSKSLEAVSKYAANVRYWHSRQTLPWSDSGLRLVTMENFMDGYKRQLDEHEENFNRLVDNFLAEYPTLISAAAFQLGELFDRDEYPAVELIASKFRFAYAFSPVPTAGDFRIDIAEQAKAELVEEYEKQFKQRLDGAMRDAWHRLHECLVHLSDRLADTDNGERKLFHNTLLSNALELTGLLSKLNVTQDSKLEQARRELADALTYADVDAIKETDHLRQAVKTKVDGIISKFEW
jgi:hypothetical protein